MNALSKSTSSSSLRFSFVAAALLCTGGALAQGEDSASPALLPPSAEASAPEPGMEAPANDTGAPASFPESSAPKAKAINLNATVVRASRASVIKRQAYNVSAIDVTKLKEKNVTVNEVLNQTSGVVVREQGGMGSGTTIALNGMSGSQVRTFIDGLPIDIFGPAMSLGSLPPNSIETIEVYKGVVPIHLGADALGGAINVLTNQKRAPYLDASYAISSFNTHRATLAGQWLPDSSRVFVKAAGFYNSSDNDYKVTVRPIQPDFTYGAPVRLRRFHDGYESYATSLEAGFFGMKYADLASVSYSYGAVHNDVQHAVSMDRVYGRAFTEDNSHTYGAKYLKRDLFADGLTVSGFAAYTDGFSKTVDTAARIYNWYGTYVPNHVESKGESGWEKLFYTWHNDAFAANATVAYSFLETNEVSFNYAVSRYASLGRDQLHAFTFQYDKPSIILNQVYGAAYKKTLFDIWTTTVFGKAYRTNPLHRSYDYDEGYEVVSRADHTFPGYGLATTVFALPSLQGKFSYERAVRVPESDEMFGDQILQEGNSNLKPERSTNLNLGALFSKRLSDFRVNAEGNLYYRGVDDLIREENGGIKTKFVNQAEVGIEGVEGEVGVDWRGILEAKVNATYDNAINLTFYNNNGDTSEVYGDRIPNRPYLYGNAYLAAHWRDPASLPGRLSLSLDTRYMHSYYLFWESQGSSDSKFTIPSQLVHSVSLVYGARADRYSLALECDNLMDEDVYDNFRQQKPGRMYSAKVRFAL